MDRENIEKLTEDLVKVCNRYIDKEKMSTEDVYGALNGVAFLIVKVSKSAEKEPEIILEENLS